MRELSAVPTQDLLNEIARRCAPSPDAAAPKWAQPVLQAVADEAGITLPALMDDTSRAPLQSLWRSAAMALLRDQTNMGLRAIGELWGMDHTTVYAACKRVNKRAAQKGETRDLIANALQRITAAGTMPPRRTAPQPRIDDSEASDQAPRISKTPSKTASQG